ncbi:MAG: pilus assembly protein PilP [Deltaproteobacteria bacterium]|nr:MAG: pilus assembly protein PilP [Deltaproteobacteria bacterium]
MLKLKRNNNFSLNWRAVSFVLAVLVISALACKEEAPPPRIEAQRPVAIPTGPQTVTVPQPTPGAEGLLLGEFEIEYRYDPYGKIDPFEPFLLVEGPGVEPENPLEQSDVNDLKLVGLIWGIRDPRAIVVDPSGKSYVVRKGTRLGRNEGELIGIYKDRIVVLEKIRNLEGDVVKTNKIDLKLEELGGGR